ncbi:MAG: GNAT family N-acetyltransferase [Thermoguttaceae bacterium]|jgi:ribosomal protein S18 acetylase RimI-like enzyme
MPIEIQPATVADAETILALQKLAYQSEAVLYDDFSIPPLVETLDQLRGLFPSHVFLKAVADGRIVGSVRAAAQAETCHIGRLIVHPDWRRQGLGSRLVAAVERQFPEVERFELFTGHKSVGNIRLYEKLGYAVYRTVAVHQRLELVYLEKRIAR